MALTALIAACREADDDTERLAALLPLAGRTLLEHQARLAARAGAGRVLVLVQRLPAALTAAIDRLRADGVSVEVARSVTDAADRVHPAERLLVFSEGLFADQRLVDRLAGASSPALMTAADSPETREWERIDVVARWAGLAVFDGDRLRRTAAILGEWDLISTMLRQAVSDGAPRLDIADGADLGAPPLHALIGTSTEAGLLSRRMLVESRRAEDMGWPARFLFAPLEEPAVSLLMGRRIEAIWLRIGAVALALLAAAAFASAWLWTGLILFLLAGPLEAIGYRLGAVRLQSRRHERRIATARASAATIAIAALGARLSFDGGNFEPAVLAVATIAFLLALVGERLLLGRLASAHRAPAWIAGADAAAWSYLPFAAFGAWRIGLAAVALYAIVSFFRVQRLARDAARHRDA